MYFQIHLTNICNFKCKHCYLENKQEIMPLEKFKIYIQKLKKYSKDKENTLAITGGEPLLISNLIDYIDYAKDLNFDIVILSNGSLINNDFCKKIKDKIKWIQVSLEGPKEINDYIRGNGSFEKILRGIKIALDNNIKISISTTINKLNYNKLFELYNEIKHLNIWFLWFDRLIPFSEELKNIEINQEEFLEFLVLLKQLKLKTIEEQSGIIISTKRALQFLPGNESDLFIYNCSTCKHSLVLMPNGDLNTCPRLNIKLGNLNRDKISDLITNNEKLIKDIHQIPNECNNCCFKQQCRGGLKCLTYNHFKDFNHGDIHCPFLKHE